MYMQVLQLSVCCLSVYLSITMIAATCLICTLKLLYFNLNICNVWVLLKMFCSKGKALSAALMPSLFRMSS